MYSIYIYIYIYRERESIVKHQLSNNIVKNKGLTDLNFNTKNICVKKCPKKSPKHYLEIGQKW